MREDLTDSVDSLCTAGGGMRERELWPGCQVKREWENDPTLPEGWYVLKFDSKASLDKLDIFFLPVTFLLRKTAIVGGRLV